MNGKENLIRDFKNSLLPHFSTGDIETISNVLIRVLADYKVETETRELALADDCNDKLLNLYLNCLSVEGKSDNTIKIYRWAIYKLSDALHKHYTDMTAYDIRFYLATMKDRNVSNTTLENTRSYFSSFFHWLESERIIEHSPMQSIKPIKTNPKQEEPFLPSEVDALRFACKKPKERAIIEVALSSGLRCAELAVLKISDIDFKSLEVKVRHGKGDKYRISYINELAAKCVEKYLATRTDDKDILFLSQLGGGSFYRTNGLSRLIDCIGSRAGVEGVHPHRFRHTMASNLAEKGMPIHEIQKLLGHVNVNTTMRYVHVSKASVKASYERLAK